MLEEQIDRSLEIETMLDMFEYHPIIAVTGVSGTGKTTTLEQMRDHPLLHGAPQSSRIYDGLDDLIHNEGGMLHHFLHAINTLPRGSIVYVDSADYIWHGVSWKESPEKSVKRRARAAEIIVPIAASIKSRNLRYVFTSHSMYDDRDSVYYSQDTFIDPFFRVFIEPHLQWYNIQHINDLRE